MSDLKDAASKYGNPEPVNHKWLDREEQRAQTAAAVQLPADQFLALIAVARNGLRPKQSVDPVAELTRQAGERPCDCIGELGGYYMETCDCHNSGDHAEVVRWCALMNAARKL